MIAEVTTPEYKEKIEKRERGTTKHPMIMFEMTLIGYVGDMKIAEKIEGYLPETRFSHDELKKRLYDRYNKKAEAAVNR